MWDMAPDEVKRNKRTDARKKKDDSAKIANRFLKLAKDKRVADNIPNFKKSTRKWKATAKRGSLKIRRKGEVN